MILIDLPLCDHAGSSGTAIRSETKTGSNETEITVMKSRPLMFPPSRHKSVLKITSETRKFGLNSRRAQDVCFGSKADIYSAKPACPPKRTFIGPAHSAPWA